MGIQDGFGELRVIGRAGAEFVAAVDGLERNRDGRHGLRPGLGHVGDANGLVGGNQAFQEVIDVPKRIDLESMARDCRKCFVADVVATSHAATQQAVFVGFGEEWVHYM